MSVPDDQVSSTEAYGLDNLPFGIFSVGDEHPRVGAAFGASIVDVGDILREEVFREPSLNAFLARGPEFWRYARTAIRDAVIQGRARCVEQSSACMHLPIEVADFVDFFSSLQHATNAGRILRPASPDLPPAWRELPIGYHGRAGTVVVSGTPLVRPRGQLKPAGGRPRFAQSAKLDVEVELGFIVGVPSQPGKPVSVDDFERHVFGLAILLDWTARDIQAWESQPLGPFLGKSFATTLSPWVVPLESLEPARLPPPLRDPEPLAYLAEARSWNLHIEFEVRVNGEVVSRPNYRDMYWSPAQQLASMTSNGAALRTGDLYGTGTISGPDPNQWGSLLELSCDGSSPVYLPSGRRLRYLCDGDQVSVRAWAGNHVGARLYVGEAVAAILPANSAHDDSGK